MRSLPILNVTTYSYWIAILLLAAWMGAATTTLAIVRLGGAKRIASVRMRMCRLADHGGILRSARASVGRVSSLWSWFHATCPRAWFGNHNLERDASLGPMMHSREPVALAACAVKHGRTSRWVFGIRAISRAAGRGGAGAAPGHSLSWRTAHGPPSGLQSHSS